MIIYMHNEIDILTKAKNDSITLTHYTVVVPAIKKFINAHDILSMTIHVFENYKTLTPEAVLDIDTIQRELLVYHINDVKPPKMLEKYCSDLMKIIRLIRLYNK